MKALIAITFLTFVSSGYSQQDKDPEYVSVNWMVGTEKTIHQTDSSVIYQADTLFMATGVSSNYKIKIVSKEDTVYEVMFRQIVIEPDFHIESEKVNTQSIEKMMEAMMTELQQKFAGFEYSFLVDKNTGQAFDVKNKKELVKSMEEMVISVLNSYITSSKINLDEKKKDQIKRKVSELMTENISAVMNTMMNSFNYIFQAYSFPYTPGQKYEMETMVYDIDELKHGNTENPAKIVINSSLKNSKLNIDYKYEYDKEAAYRQYIVSKGREKEIPIDQFDVDERVVANFDMLSSWITDHTSSAKVKMGTVKVYQTSRVVIR